MSNATQTFRGKVVAETSGTRWFIPLQTTTDPGTEKTLYWLTVPSGKAIWLLHFYVSCFQPGVLKIFQDSAEIASVRTGAGNYNGEFYFLPYHEILTGETIMVKFKAMVSKPESDIEVYLQGREVSA